MLACQETRPLQVPVSDDSLWHIHFVLFLWLPSHARRRQIYLFSSLTLLAHPLLVFAHGKAAQLHPMESAISGTTGLVCLPNPSPGNHWPESSFASANHTFGLTAFGPGVPGPVMSSAVIRVRREWRQVVGGMPTQWESPQDMGVLLGRAGG